MAKEQNRFISTYKQGSAFSTIVEVLVDRQTGVNYMWVKEGYGAGLCPLLGRDGKPVVTTIGSAERD